MAQPSAGQPAQEAREVLPNAALVLEREADANLANHFSSVQARLQNRVFNQKSLPVFCTTWIACF